MEQTVNPLHFLPPSPPSPVELWTFCKLSSHSLHLRRLPSLLSVPSSSNSARLSALSSSRSESLKHISHFPPVILQSFSSIPSHHHPFSLKTSPDIPLSSHSLTTLTLSSPTPSHPVFLKIPTIAAVASSASALPGLSSPSEHASPPPSAPPPPPLELLVGYVASRKKQRQFFNGLEETASTWIGRFGPDGTAVSVRLLRLADDDPIPPALHAVFHKRTDDMAAALATHDSAARVRCLKLANILEHHCFFPPLRNTLPRLASADPVPHVSHPVVPVDPLDGVWKLVDRSLICDAVDQAFGYPPDSKFLLTTPSQTLHNVAAVPWVQISVKQSEAGIREQIQGKLRFPVILKRRLACGSKVSHEMVVAYDIDGAIAAINVVFGPGPVIMENGKSRGNGFLPGLVHPANDFACDVIVQEFIPDHGGVLFKIYAIGKKLVVQPRLSVDHTISGPAGSYYYFDSQRLGRTEGLQGFAFDKSTGRCKATKAVMPSEELSAAVVAELSKELGLSLIGVDLVYDLRTKKYHVVDINYFPGYKGVATANKWILEHVCNLVWKRLQESNDGK